MSNFDYQDATPDDTDLYIKAAVQGWPLKPEHLQLCVDKLVAALETTSSPREVKKLSDAFARLHGQNQTARLSRQYIDAVGSGTQGGAIIQVKQMLASVHLASQESTGEGEPPQLEQAGNSSCLPLVPRQSSPTLDVRAFGPSTSNLAVQ